MPDEAEEFGCFGSVCGERDRLLQKTSRIIHSKRNWRSKYSGIYNPLFVESLYTPTCFVKKYLGRKALYCLLVFSLGMGLAFIPEITTKGNKGHHNERNTWYYYISIDLA